MKRLLTAVLAVGMLIGLTRTASALPESFGCTNTLLPGFVFANWPTNGSGSGLDTGGPVNIDNYDEVDIIVSGVAYNTVSSNRIYLQPVRSFSTSPPGTNILGLLGWETNGLAAPVGIPQLIITPPTSGSSGSPFVWATNLDHTLAHSADYIGLAPNLSTLSTSNGVNFATGSTQVISNFVVKVQKKIRPIRYP